MADPVTLSIIEASTAIAGGISGYKAGMSEADTAGQNMIAAQREGTAAAQVEGQKSREAIGRATALAAASGFAVTGSATDVIGGIAAQGTFNVDQAIYQGRRRMMQAREDQIAAKRRAKAAAIAGVSQAASALTNGMGGGPAPGGPVDAMGNPVAGGL